MRPVSLLFFFGALLILTVPALMAQSAWDIDPAHSAAQFQVKHLMISNVRGEFGKMSGKIVFDGRTMQPSRLKHY
jgi:polyisoprenoid-binding protein YceI